MAIMPNLPGAMSPQPAMPPATPQPGMAGASMPQTPPTPIGGGMPQEQPGMAPEAPAELMAGENPIINAFKTLMLLSESLEQAGHPNAGDIKMATQNLISAIQGVGSPMGEEMPMEMGMSMGPTGRPQQPMAPASEVDRVSGRAPGAGGQKGYNPDNSKYVPVM